MTVAPQTITVTGANGFIGRHLCDHFRRQGWQVRGLVRDTSSYPFGEKGIELHRCDLPDTLDDASLRGADVVAHLAYMMRFTNLEAARRVNDLGTRRVLERGQALGVGRFVFLSSQSAHARAESYYGRSKLELEKLFTPQRDVIVRSGLVVARSGDGLFHRMCNMVRTARVIPLFGGGRQPIQTLHVDDLCAGISAALDRDLAGTFSLSEPGAIEMRAFFKAIAARLGKKPLFVPFPMGPALLALRLIEACRIPFPVSSENLLGMKCLQATDTRQDLARLGITARDALQSLDETLGSGR